VDVEMVYRLATIFACVDYYAIAFREALFASQICCHPQEVTEEGGMFFACFGQRNEVFAGRDQEMYGGLGVNIGKGVTAVVLIFGIRRNASLNDLAEKAGHDRTSVLGSQRRERFVLSHLERLRARSRSLSTSLRAGFRLPFTAFRVAQGDGGSGSGLVGFPPFPQKQTERMGHGWMC
jgi:hypothetical protein